MTKTLLVEQGPGWLCYLADQAIGRGPPRP